MSDRYSFGQTEGTFCGEFQDQAFELRSLFDFDELSHLQNNMKPVNAFGGEHMDFHIPDGMHNETIDQNLFGGQPGTYPMGTNTFDPDMSLVDPANVWTSINSAQMNLSVTVRVDVQPTAKSAQTEIVSSRPGHVRQRFGQITPPDDNTPENLDIEPSKTATNPQRAQEEEIAKLHRTQRARNAANKRHAKSKKASKNIRQDNGSDGTEDEDGQSKNISVQREKNRIAAAKCRAKKKATVEEMQENHRKGAQANSFLQCEVRELRHQRAFLRNTLLQHEPGMCKSNAIHQYNLVQAQKLAFGVGAMGIQPVSPSQENMGSAQTPCSNASGGPSFQEPVHLQLHAGRPSHQGDSPLATH